MRRGNISLRQWRPKYVIGLPSFSRPRQLKVGANSKGRRDENQAISVHSSVFFVSERECGRGRYPAGDSMNTGGPRVAAGVDMADKAGDALRQINEASAVALSNVSDIAAATTGQSQASGSVARNVEQISSMLEESAQSVQAANENVTILEHLAENLRQSVTRFKILKSAVTHGNSRKPEALAIAWFCVI